MDAIGQKVEGGLDERVVLFVKISNGFTVSAELEKRIKAEIRARRSPRHVPARVSDSGLGVLHKDPFLTAPCFVLGIHNVQNEGSFWPPILIW